MQIGTVLRDLFQHMEWADAEVWSAVHRLGADDKRLRDLLNHLHMTQRSFFDVWSGKGFDRGFLKERTLAEAEEMGRAYHRDASEFIAKLDEASLDQPLILPWAERFAKGASATTLGDTMLQITSHSTYHRGQTNMRIRELGGDPPLVDFIAWLWLGRPRAVWSA
jgi:uncharacterized damage-inducible protein DinB